MASFEGALGAGLSGFAKGFTTGRGLRSKQQQQALRQQEAARTADLQERRMALEEARFAQPTPQTVSPQVITPEEQKAMQSILMLESMRFMPDGDLTAQFPNVLKQLEAEGTRFVKQGNQIEIIMPDGQRKVGSVDMHQSMFYPKFTHPNKTAVTRQLASIVYEKNRPKEQEKTQRPYAGTTLGTSRINDLTQLKLTALEGKDYALADFLQQEIDQRLGRSQQAIRPPSPEDVQTAKELAATARTRSLTDTERDFLIRIRNRQAKTAQAQPDEFAPSPEAGALTPAPAPTPAAPPEPSALAQAVPTPPAPEQQAMAQKEAWSKLAGANQIPISFDEVDSNNNGVWDATDQKIKEALVLENKGALKSDSPYAQNPQTAPLVEEYKAILQAYKSTLKNNAQNEIQQAGIGM